MRELTSIHYHWMKISTLDFMHNMNVSYIFKLRKPLCSYYMFQSLDLYRHAVNCMKSWANAVFEVDRSIRSVYSTEPSSPQWSYYVIFLPFAPGSLLVGPNLRSKPTLTQIWFKICIDIDFDLDNYNYTISTMKSLNTTMHNLTPDCLNLQIHLKPII